MRRFYEYCFWYSVTLFVLLFFAAIFSGRARAEKMVVERVVPPGATLTYSEGGVPVRTISVPEGRVRVIIEYGGAITPRHERRK